MNEEKLFILDKELNKLLLNLNIENLDYGRFENIFIKITKILSEFKLLIDEIIIPAFNGKYILVKFNNTALQRLSIYLGIDNNKITNIEVEIILNLFKVLSLIITHKFNNFISYMEIILDLLKGLLAKN
ncbi:MAG: hypothetical protein SOY42_10775 [Clostridium sp.]|nr:hypothetical protein [Clostridium sp.]